MISGFCRQVDENCSLLGYYAACSGIFLPTFRHNLSIPPSGVKKSAVSWPLKMGPMGCPETSAWNYRYTLRNNLEERSSYEVIVT